MDIVSLLAVFGGIATVAAALKAIPVIWNAIKRTGAFFTSLESISDIDGLGIDIVELGVEHGEIKDRLLNVDQKLEKVDSDIKQIGQIAKDFNEYINLFNANSTNLAISIFKSHASHSGIPHYIFKVGENSEDRFVWGNKAWYHVYGFDSGSMVNGQVWDSILPEDAKKLHDALKSVAHNPSEFRVKYRIRDDTTGEIKSLAAYSWPLIPVGYKSGDEILYLGGIEVD